MIIRKTLLAGAAFCGLVLGSSSASAIKINFDFQFGNVDPVLALKAMAGFEEAAAQWEALLKDKVTVNITAGFQDLGNANVIAQAGSNSVAISYSAVKAALELDAKGANDATAVANLFQGDSLSFFTNTLGTEDGGPGIDATRIGGTADTDSLLMSVNTANAKALGFNVGDVTDAAITFNSIFDFDFDRNDGIDGSQVDFVGVAIHEIGHALGFVSGVDPADSLSGVGVNAITVRNVVEDPVNAAFFRNLLGLPDDAPITRDLLADFNWFDVGSIIFGENTLVGAGFLFSPLDLFRFSDLSFDDQGNFLGLDLTTGEGRIGPLVNADLFNLPDNSNPFFSIDGGLTNIAPFSTGSANGIDFLLDFGMGDVLLRNFQASHFLETFGAQNPAIGIMEAAFGRGEFGLISAADILAFDAIGYDLIPEPAAIALFGFGLLGFGALRRRKQK